MSIWAPVVAALGTGVLGFGGIWWQQRHRDRASALAEKGDAYHQLIAHSLSFTIRARTLRDAMRRRSGLAEGLDVALGKRRPSDPMELHDWFAQGWEPLNQAWSKIQVIGSPAAEDAATEVIDACADLVAVATDMGQARGKTASALRGLDWTSEQQEALENAATRVVKGRGAFIEIARGELGKRRGLPGPDAAEAIEPTASDDSRP